MRDTFEIEHEKRIDTQEELGNIGGRKDLFMFLSGEGGSGKTTTKMCGVFANISVHN